MTPELTKSQSGTEGVKGGVNEMHTEFPFCHVMMQFCFPSSHLQITEVCFPDAKGGRELVPGAADV